MVLVTSAAGKTGRAIIGALAAKGQNIRALVRSEARIPAVTAAGAGETVVGEFDDAATLSQAMRGVRAIYHICPNMSRDEIKIGQGVIEAAKAEGVQHFVLHSVLHPQTQAMPHHWAKLQVEEWLMQSGMPFTILQPTAYMQNLLASWKNIVEEGVLRNPYSVATRLSLVDVNDVAEAAAIALTESGHFNATYEVCGTEPLSQTQVAEVISLQLHRPVRAEATPLDEWERTAGVAGLNDYVIATLKAMFLYYERFGLCGNPNVLRWLLRRESTSLADFVSRTMETASLRLDRAVSTDMQ
ncbi:MAG: SDR family oxidoreductase [Anaerolineales bacterium]